jgi:glycosyltransferase involved in cell wall biosynthesis
MNSEPTPTVRILGGHDLPTAYSVVNREWRLGLERAGIVVLDEGRADVLIHHDYSVRFGEVPLPAAGRRVAVRPWDFGPYPRRWVDVVEEQYDELWVFTRWGRECATRSGLAPERVRIVPHGVDLRAFTPDGPVYPLTNGRPRTFVFVGAAIVRKGIDITLRAFLDAFSEDDDVQLIVKDHAGDVFYDGITRREDVLAAANRPGAAPIRYLDTYLPRAELAALYRGATALVHPARAEGWALPVLESLACGTPVIAPRFGPFLDYCAPPAAELVSVHRIRAPVQRDFAVNTLGFREHVESVDFCEPDIASVTQALRDSAAWSPIELATRRTAARNTAEQWPWDRTVSVIAGAVAELADT